MRCGGVPTGSVGAAAGGSPLQAKVARALQEGRSGWFCGALSPIIVYAAEAEIVDSTKYYDLGGHGTRSS